MYKIKVTGRIFFPIILHGINYVNLDLSFLFTVNKEEMKNC